MTIPGEAEGRRFTVETLTADLLEIDPHVQRKLNDSRVAKIAADFHEAAYRYVIKVYNSGRRSRQLDPRS